MWANHMTLEDLGIGESPNFDSAIDWIIRSGIQSADGGFYAWYDRRAESYSFLYPETTGYAIELLVRLWRTSRVKRFLDNAIKAGNWLAKIQRENGAFYCKYYDDASYQVSEDCDRSLYAFDAAICLSALLDLYEETSEMKYLDLSLKTANWLLTLQNSDGSFVAGYNTHGEVMENSHWSRTRGCHLLKNILALLKSHQMTKTRECLGSATKLLRWGQNLQGNSGRFAISTSSKETYFHAHCYATEGLLFSSKLLNNVTNITPTERAIHAARWLSEVQNIDGSVSNWHNSNREKAKVSDGLSQALGIWMIAGRLLSKHQQDKMFSLNIGKGLNFLGSQQCLSGDRHSYGGFYYGEQNGEKIEHVNTWVTLFALRIPLLLKEMGNVSRMIDLLF